MTHILVHGTRSPLGMGLPWYPGDVASRRGGTQKFQRYIQVWATVLFLLLLYASYAWYKVRQCVFDCCIWGVNIVVVRPPHAVHQQHTHTPWVLARNSMRVDEARKGWSHLAIKMKARTVVGRGDKSLTDPGPKLGLGRERKIKGAEIKKTLKHRREHWARLPVFAAVAQLYTAFRVATRLSDRFGGKKKHRSSWLPCVPMTAHTPRTEAHTYTYRTTARGCHKRMLLLLSR